MHINGFIIQKDVNNSYKGVDGSGFSSGSGENWYLNSHPDYEDRFEPYYEECIDRGWMLSEQSWVSACTDLEYIRKYISVSKTLGIKYRVLIVMTDVPAPVMELSPDIKMNFLGYDYAYIGGDNYSAVYNEIPFVFPDVKLNSNGLIQTMEEMDTYLKQREEFVATHPKYTLEDGDFVIFKVYEANL